MADLGGRPLVDWSAAAMEGAGLSLRAAIVRPGDHALQAVLSARGFAVVENPSADEGMGTSIAAGAVWALERDADGALIALGDAPRVSTETIGRLLGALSPADGRSIVVARDGDRRGGLVVFSRAFLPSLAALRGDSGGRSLLAAHPEVVAEVPCVTPGELHDVDTPEALAAVRERIARL